jgi:WD40 repeat protein
MNLIRNWSATLPDHVIGVSWSHDGKLVAAAAVSGPIVVFDSNTGAKKFELAGHGFGTTAIAFQPNSHVLASAGQDGKLRLWDMSSGKETAKLEGGAAWVEKLAWSSNGEYLASGAGKKLRLWKPGGEMVREYPSQASTISDIVWRNNSLDLTTACYGQVNVWSPESETPKRVLEHKGSILVVAWSPDGKHVAAGCQDATVHLWIYKSGEDLEMSGYPVKVRELAWDHTSRYLATGGGPIVMIWDFSGKGPAGSEPIQLIAHAEDKSIALLTYQSAGPYLLSGGTDGTLALWHPGKVKRPLAKSNLDGVVTAANWSPSDLRIVAASEQGTVTVFST